jgi:c-di-GMP-binding flagellar brake protein YcgR
MLTERRREGRRNNGDYMRVTDNITSDLIGYVIEISQGGFRLECPKALAVGEDRTMRLEYTIEVQDKSFIVFIARARWIRPDPVMPNEYVQGFQIVSMEPAAKKIYQGIVENYGVLKRF